MFHAKYTKIYQVAIGLTNQIKDIDIQTDAAESLYSSFIWIFFQNSF